MTDPQEPVVSSRSVRFPAGQFLVLFLPVAVIVLATAFSYVALRTAAQLEATIEDERTQLYHISGFIGAEVSSSLNHLRSLAEEAAVRGAIAAPDEGGLRTLQSVFLTLAKRNPEYQQVRWIDQAGAERVRVMRDGGQPYSVSAPELQDKGERYYFTAANALLTGQLYVSRLDLNVEHGESEIPPRPMLRIATPVEDSNAQRRGILVINIAVRQMLEVLRGMRHAAADTRYLLLNQEGYRLGGSHDDRSSDRRLATGTRFVELYPQIWRQIADRKSGSAELASGLWIWETLSPADTVRSLTRALSQSPSDAPRLHADELSLTLVAHKPLIMLMQTRRDIRMPIMLGALLVLLVYGLSLFFYLRSHVVERRSELNAAYALARASNLERLKELEERFRRLVEASSVGQVVVDAEGRIFLANPAADAMLGYRAGELTGRLVDDSGTPTSRTSPNSPTASPSRFDPRSLQFAGVD